MGISSSFLARRLLRAEEGGGTGAGGSVSMTSTGEEFFDLVLRPPRRFGDGG